MALVANNQGRISGKFTIPANVPSGRKEFVVSGSQGNRGSAIYVGDGAVTDQVVRWLTTVTFNRYDPVAQTFSLLQPEQVKAVDLFITAKGSKPVRVQLRETAFGVPTQTVLGEAVLGASGITAGAWNRFEFSSPINLSANVEYAAVVLSEEASPAVGIAELGKYDAASAKWVTSQPYQVGVLLSSSNASTWTPHQDRDLAFRIVGQRYTEDSRLVELGAINVSNVTEFRLQGLIEAPVQGATGDYQLEFPDGRVVRVGNGQVVSLPAPVTGAVKVRAAVSATATHSAVLHPGTFVAAGSLATSADYVTRAIEADALGADVRVVFDAVIPSGATVKVYYKGLDAGDNWVEMPLAGAPKPLDDKLYEFSFASDDVMEARLRIKLVLAGSPTARPRVRNLRVTVL
jgi:hypothetical protein